MMKKAILLSISALFAATVFAGNWAAIIDAAPESALWQINGKTVKKAAAQELNMAEVDTVAIYTQDQAPAELRAKAVNGYVSVYTKVHQMAEMEKKEAEFKGGKEALDKFFADNLVYPEADKENKVNGYVVVKFMISTEGEIQSPEITRHLTPASDAEALRLVGIMPNWEPGRMGGNAVTSIYQLPILFKCPKVEKPVTPTRQRRTDVVKQ